MGSSLELAKQNYIMHNQRGTAMRETINLEEPNAQLNSLNHEEFVADLAGQCASVLNWIAQPSQPIIQETLWKNEMRKKASEEYPELDNEEVRRLVDRDWKVMSESNRNAIIQKYTQEQDPLQLSIKAVEIKDRLFSIKKSLEEKE